MKTVKVKSLGDCPYVISLETEDLIGQGSSAQVRKAYNKSDSSQRLAAKIFEVESNKMSTLFRELSVACNLPEQKNLISYQKLKISSKNRVYLIMERCKTNLRKQFINLQNQDQIWNFLHQFCEGYKILNQAGIVHRDIKPDNILIDFEGNYKIADFGLAEFYASVNCQKNGQVRGSLPYLAPQLFENRQHISPLNDVFSLGVTLYEICFARIPYVNTKSAYLSIGNFIQQTKNSKLQFPKNQLSQILITLIKSMLERKPAHRCTWEYIYHIISNQKHAQKCNIVYQNVSSCKLAIVEISDAVLQNLSRLDTEVYNLLGQDSLVVIDHIEADILWKRQITYFCDRLQFRLRIIYQKSKEQIFLHFSLMILKYASKMACNLDQEFEKCYLRIEKSDLLRFMGSRKYKFIRILLKNDSQSLLQEIKEDKIYFSQYQIQKNDIFQQIETSLYALCYQTIIRLYRYGHFEECLQVDELERWLELKEKSQGLLFDFRKNGKRLRQFDQQNFQISSEEVKMKICMTYRHRLNIEDLNRLGSRLKT